MDATTAPSATSAGRKPVFSEGYKRLVLSLLLAAYTFNFIDRTIIATIGPKIREDLGLTSTQIGLLGGLYFALLYTTLGVPLARLAERKSRVNIISAAVLIWSGFTALCGTAGSFAVLAAYRFGVGIGEAGLSPPSHSLISDYFEPKKRASALGVYSFGIPLGTMFGAVAGGWIAQNFSWRMAFILVGLPGVLIAALVKFLMREPPRGHSELEAPETARNIDELTPVAVEAPKGHWLAEEMREMAAVSKVLFGSWPVLNMILGVTLCSFGAYGAGQFVPQYFRSAFHLDIATVGLITGLVGGISTGLGTLVGGFLTDRLSKRSPAWYSLTPAIGLTIATPIYIYAYTRPTWQAAALVLLIPGLFHYTYLAPTFGVVQNMVEVRRRATAAALMLFFLNLIALGGGPPFTGWLIDQFAQFDINHPAVQGVVGKLAHLFDVGGALNAVKACPGGVAPKTADAAAKALCSATLTQSTREGILVSVCFYLWAGFHYLLGAFGLTKALADARAARGEA
ncbi:spinster family MFS transporter [Phenylobacterium montanum]|uniref:MFS transporter n=1 Tax=Phenylobacterium montanum TaxID=2823693 RepID=A0A975FZN9_9CAUL|nr:MFS transporter [Caulobacter sp. S6]QUD87792.1 MFS transporter [Caulobacter sp. S6]